MGDEMNLIAKLPFFIGRRPSIWSHASEQPPLGERGPVQGTVADDDVVVERDVEQPRAVGKLAREPDASRLGVGSPDGWLCSRMIDAAPSRSTGPRTSRECTRLALWVPTETSVWRR